MNFFNILKRIKQVSSLDRIGPDIFTTYWKLYFNESMLKLCKKKFKHFDETAEFRPGAYAVSCSHISIGKRVTIRPLSMLQADENAYIIIEDDVLIGPGVHIYVDNHKFDNPHQPIIDQGYYPSKDVIIKKGSWIGANCIILPGVTIGENAVIAAGSIVNHSVKPKTVVGGNPITTIKKIS